MPGFLTNLSRPDPLGHIFFLDQLRGDGLKTDYNFSTSDFSVSGNEDGLGPRSARSIVLSARSHVSTALNATAESRGAG